jgi:putative ABC transport system ATP-binding protein
MSAILQLVDVCRVFRQASVDVLALTDVSLSVAPGELVAVMGPSGSGKSTLLNVAGGLDWPTSGTVFVDGTDLATLSVSALAALRRASLGYVFQELNLVRSLTAVENVSLPLELDGRSARQGRAEAIESLELVGMSGQADRFPDELSGGQQQRVAIARGLVGTRRLLLADEPTGALDSASGEGIVSLLRQRCDSGCAALLVTHEPRYAGWADRVVYLRDGAVVERASVLPDGAQ